MTLPATWRAGLILIAATIIFAIVWAAAPARATDEKQYVTVAWVIDNPDDIWAPAQHSPIRVDGPAVDFAAVQALVGCGKFYQLDGYNAGETTEALIAGGVLYEPSNPAEDLAHDAPGTEATGGVPWLYYSAPDCVETACISESQIQTDNFRYSWDGSASVRTVVSSISATLTEADAITAGCYTPPVVDPLPPVTPPVVAELAHAGPVSTWMLAPALLALLFGAAFLLTRNIAKRRGF